MTMAGYPNHGGEPEEVEWGSVDPAPAAEATDVAALTARVLDGERPMFRRMQALFALRALRTPEAVEAIGRALREPPSALLRHEAAYVLGQMQDAAAIPALATSLLEDPHAMVRHEAAEALGNIDDDRVVPLLKRALVEDETVEVRESCMVALDNLAWLRDDEVWDHD